MTFRGLGRCKFALWFAVALDVIGLVALLVGIFANLQRAGRDYGDMLIYTGAIVVFVSLIGWVFWYTGNIEISWEELASDYQPKAGRLHRIVRTLSRSISMRNKDGRSSKLDLALGIGELSGKGEGGQPKEVQTNREGTQVPSSME
ncbi:transmembrane protein 238-like [Heptranchias perlo]|uniref:transmembrane protein 238-like n=1 Tax=Heptranchias perlo TaxID=212740 RepID=UPI00355A3ECD